MEVIVNAQKAKKMVNDPFSLVLVVILKGLKMLAEAAPYVHVGIYVYQYIRAKKK